MITHVICMCTHVCRTVDVCVAVLVCVALAFVPSRFCCPHGMSCEAVSSSS